VHHFGGLHCVGNVVEGKRRHQKNRLGNLAERCENASHSLIMLANIKDVENWNAIRPVKGKSPVFRRFDLELFRVSQHKKMRPVTGAHF